MLKLQHKDCAAKHLTFDPSYYLVVFGGIFSVSEEQAHSGYPVATRDVL